MTIRVNGSVVKVSVPVLRKSAQLVVIPLVHPDVDFPPSVFLPQFTLSVPPRDDRDAYGLYLYKKEFEPYRTDRRGGYRGRRNSNSGEADIRDVSERSLVSRMISDFPLNHLALSLKVSDLSKRNAKKDAEIVREIFGELEYLPGDKPTNLAKVRDLKKYAEKAIAAIYP